MSSVYILQGSKQQNKSGKGKPAEDKKQKVQAVVDLKSIMSKGLQF